MLVAPYALSIQPSIKAVYISMYCSKLTGKYWENTLLDEYQSIVRQTSLADRLDFYLAILVKSDLDTSKANTFVDIVGSDSSSFGELLRAIESHPLYDSLDIQGINRINIWKNNF